MEENLDNVTGTASTEMESKTLNMASNITSMAKIISLYVDSKVEDTTAKEKIAVKSRVSVHDPSIIKNGDEYYVFGSHIDAAKSVDLQNWTQFTNGYTTPGNVIFGDLSENLAGSFAWAGEDDSDSKGGFSCAQLLCV